MVAANSPSDLVDVSAQVLDGDLARHPLRMIVQRGLSCRGPGAVAELRAKFSLVWRPHWPHRDPRVSILGGDEALRGLGGHTITPCNMCTDKYRSAATGCDGSRTRDLCTVAISGAGGVVDVAVAWR